MAGARPAVRLYTRVGCHLCVDAALALADLAGALGFEVDAVDVDGDPELVARYGERVPVVEVGGEVVAEGAIDPAALRSALERALRT